MFHRRFPIILAFVTLLTAAADTTQAQSQQPLQLGAGYQVLHISFDGAGETFPLGAYVSVDRVLRSDDKKSWGWMGQVEAGFRRDDGFSEQLYTFLGGIRLASTRPTKWTPSGHGLIGFGTLNASCTEFCAGTDSGVAFQAGFAVSSRIDTRRSISIGFNATKLKVQGGGLFNVAGAVGIRLTLGQSPP